VDEEYKHTFADVDRHILARFRERPPESDPKANMDIIWTREIGKGRVFYNALGHDKEAWENPAWQKLTVQGILWAAGRPREVQLRTAAPK
jgi:type 1 glutamine amidotransferase